MAAVDYAGIRDQLAEVLTAAISNCRIFIEEEPQPGMVDQARACAIYMIGRQAVPDQSLASGKRTRWHVRLSIWVFYFGGETFKAAADGRDTLVGEMELALMANRTLNGKVDSSWFEGGDLFNAKNPTTGTFLAGAETVLVAQASAVNA